MSPDTKAACALRLDAGNLDADAPTIDSLARLALVARRCGLRLVVQHASRELTDLIELAGLSQALGVESLRPGSTPPRC